VRALVINTGNANAGTGAAGLQAAEASCRVVAEQLGCAPRAVLPFSTGVIGEPVALAEKIAAVLPTMAGQLAENQWEAAAAAIMTTDTIAKACSRQVELDGVTITVTGMAKGSGMIRPDMATMLAYIATDAPLHGTALQQCLQEAMAQSFNRITVDGDTSTNDACILMATGQAVMAQEEIPVRVDLGRGAAEAQIWTCDLSCDYVRINADYRS
jgi:glutamate N-acetyltransferase/amino-acid N-acetyltransferase